MGTSLKTGVRSILRWRGEQEGTVWQLDHDAELFPAKQVLAVEMVKLQKFWNKAGQEKSEAFLYDEVQAMLHNFFSADSPVGLLQRTYLLLGLQTAAWISWPQGLMADDFNDVRTTSTGREYFIIKGEPDKNHQAGLMYKPHQYFVFTHPADSTQCPVWHVRCVLSLRPPNCGIPYFYFQWNQSTRPGAPWFKQQNAGKRWLSEIILNYCRTINWPRKAPKTHYASYALMACFMENHEELLHCFLQTKEGEYTFVDEIQTGFFGNSLAVAVHQVLICDLRYVYLLSENGHDWVGHMWLDCFCGE